MVRIGGLRGATLMPCIKVGLYLPQSGTAQGAAAAAQAAISEGAELLLGPLYAAEVQAVAPVARQANVPVLAFSSDRKVAGNGVYLLSFLAGADVDRAVTFAASNGKRNSRPWCLRRLTGRWSSRRFRRR